MLSRSLFLILILLSTSNQLFAARDLFLPYFQDLPLMQGLEVQEDEALLFDKVEGRIISVTAYSKMPPKKIIKFYEQLLPQLGWQQVDKTLYIREGASLKIEVSLKGFLTKVHFFSFPKLKTRKVMDN